MVGSPQTLAMDQRRILADWAATRVDQVLGIFESTSPGDRRVQDAVDLTRAFAAGRLAGSEAIRRRGGQAGAAARAAPSPAGRAAAYAAEQAASVAHMGAHALGAAGYAIKARVLDAQGDAPDVVTIEAERFVGTMSEEVATALAMLPLLATDSRGPLAPGRLGAGLVGEAITAIQQRLADRRPRPLA